jgi:hypothetical protein
VAAAEKSDVFNRTRWAMTRGPESEFVKRLSLGSALYAALGRRIGAESALVAVDELLVPIGCSEQCSHLRSLDSTESTGMKRLMAFHELMDERGAPRFNTREYVRRDENVCHFRITRCIFDEFFAEAGTPELATAFCEVDRRFFPEAFPGFRFHRGDSWENTIAFGKSHCESVFEKKGGKAGA